MRIAASIPFLVGSLILVAAPAYAAGGGGHSSSPGKASNRYQASWHMAVPLGSTNGETVVMFEDGDAPEADDAHGAPADHAEAEAGAADHPAPAAHAAEGEAESASLIDLPIVVAPLVVDGDLRNYAFVSMQLDVAPGHDPWKVREQAAYLRDAMLRAAHEHPVNPPRDPGRVDPDIATRVWTAAAEQVLGQGVVAGLHIVGSDIRYPELAGAE